VRRSSLLRETLSWKSGIPGRVKRNRGEEKRLDGARSSPKAEPRFAEKADSSGMNPLCGK